MDTQQMEEIQKHLDNLGKLGRDKVTKFEGVISVVGIHLYGCNTYLLVPRVTKDGTLGEAHNFDVGRIEIIEDCVKPEEVQTSKPSGEKWNAEERA
jgi:hypothetical protein